MKKYLVGLITFLSIILLGLVVIFVLVLNGTITRNTLGIDSKKTATSSVQVTEVPIPQPTATTTPKKIVVLDAGHGKSSSLMSDAEKTEEMWIKNTAKGSWGEWRHWKSNTTWTDCEGSDCSKRVPSGGSCWYSMSDGDRSVEPDINLNNTLSAQKYLEEMGYEVRMTRTNSEQNPSMTKRLVYCYKDLDVTTTPDADIFVCIHSNAGGGRGSAYISLSGLYDQAGTLPAEDYVSESNTLGKCINDQIVSGTSLTAFSDGKYDGFPTTILFCKSPIPIAYLEIGFFDSSSDLNILNTESDKIGKSIAIGIDNYFKSK